MANHIRIAQLAESPCHTAIRIRPAPVPGAQPGVARNKTAISMVCRHFSFTKAAHAGSVGEVFAFTLMPTNVLLDFSVRDHGPAARAE
jgi:hypothetical protein